MGGIVNRLENMRFKFIRTNQGGLLGKWGSAFALLILLAGCGGKFDASVSGVAMLKGAPLTVGDVALHPVHGGGDCLWTHQVGRHLYDWYGQAERFTAW